MKTKFLLILLISAPAFVKAQSKIVYDTLVVYDTLIVYDTVYIEEDIAIKRRILKSELTSFFFDKKTATFFRTDIIVNENNQKTLAMKKITIFGILLFSLNHGLLAQTRLGVTAGATAWAVRDNDHHINNPVSGGFRLGIFSETRISNRLSIALAPTYYFLKGGADFKVTNYIEPGQWQPAPIYIDNNAHNLTQYFSTNRYQFGLALKMITTIKRLKPFVGIEYTSTIWYRNLLQQPTTYEPYQRMTRSDLGFIGGLSYRVSNAMEIDAEYYTAFSMSESEVHHIGTYVFGYQRLTLGVRYFLRTLTIKKRKPQVLSPKG